MSKRTDLPSEAKRASKVESRARASASKPNKPTRSTSAGPASRSKARPAAAQPARAGRMVDSKRPLRPSAKDAPPARATRASKGAQAAAPASRSPRRGMAVPIQGAPQEVVARALVNGLARDSLWEENGGGGSLSPFLDVIRGLGRETEGVVIREPRVLQFPELTALGHDGIARNCFSIKVEQALAPGHTLQLLGVASTQAAEITKRATEKFIALGYEKIIRLLGVSASQYGDAVMVNSYTHDEGVDSLKLPLQVVRRGTQRWVQQFDKRDFIVRGVCSSTSPHYRSASWMELTPYNASLDIDRITGGGYGGFGRSTGDSARALIHPSRYIRLTTGSGYSVLQECAQYIANLLLAAGGGAALMQRASAGVFSIKDWETQLFAQGSNAQAKLQAQFDVLGSRNAMVLSEGEAFEWANLTISGIEGGIYSSAYLLSAALRIPMVILLGASPGSFVSGESQTVQWHQVLDGVRKWLEPALWRAWDNCIAEVTGGLIPDYELAWGSYEPPDTKDGMERKTQALELAAQYEDKGYIGKEAAIAGLSTTEGEDFDVNTALSVPRPEAPATPKTEIEVGKVTAIFTAVQAYLSSPVRLDPGPFRAATRVLVPETAAEVENMFPDLPPLPAGPMLEGASGAPGVPVTALPPAAAGVAAAGGSPKQDTPAAAGKPAPVTAMVDPAAEGEDPGEPWLKPRTIGQRYSIGAATLVRMRTPLPGMRGTEAQIEWLQTPAGHARYRESDVLRILRMGKAKPETVDPDEDEDPDVVDSDDSPEEAATQSKGKRGKAKDTQADAQAEDMAYMGGKARFGKPIVEAILEDLGRERLGVCVDLCCGVGGVTHRLADVAERVIAVDLHPGLIALQQEVQEGWVPPRKVSRRTFMALKKQGPDVEDALHTFIGFACSFGGQWFSGYASNTRGYNYAKAASASLVRKSRPNITFVHGDALAYEPPDEVEVVFADPPYEGTAGFAALADLFVNEEGDAEETDEGDLEVQGADREESPPHPITAPSDGVWWKRMQAHANAGKAAYITEYKDPPEGVQARLIWSGRTGRGNLNAGKNKEKLWRVLPETGHVKAEFIGEKIVPAEAAPAVDAMRGSKARRRKVVVQQYVWRTQKDDRVRPEHADREGHTFSWDTPPEDGNPGQPYNCRCWAEFVAEDGALVRDRALMSGWPVSGVQWEMERVSDETGVSGTGVVVKGLALADGSIVSWWIVSGMPPRPHVDAEWADFYEVHIAKHPSNGTVVRVLGEDGTWHEVSDLELGPAPVLQAK